MIELKSLSKNYNNSKILNEISYIFPNTGLVAIVGESGCGKTTLLNCISLLTDYDGEIIIDGTNLKSIPKNEVDFYRLKHFGFVFQDFKLFEDQTVFNNVCFPLNCLSNFTNKFKEQKAKDILSIVGQNINKNQIVKQLSGGEKQRVAIARAIINDQKIILADEPTGALDNENAKSIMELLLSLSSRSLVIVVSHDYELVKKYASQIIKMKDGRIEKVIKQEINIEKKFIPVSKNPKGNRKGSLSFSFLYSHTKNNLKNKKWRTLICTSITSLSLIGVGISFTLSATVSKNIKDAYSSIVDTSKIIVSVKDDNKSIYKRYGGSYYEASYIQNALPNYIKDIGVFYDSNFESFFPFEDDLTFKGRKGEYVIKGFSSRSINEFEWLEDANETIYPNQIDTLEEDEVVLSLNINSIYTICMGLEIDRSVKALSDYLETTPIYISFNFSNPDWEYEDNQILKIKGFILNNNQLIYHSDHRWNEYMFEERMRFPTSDSIDSPSYYPWTLKKIYFYKPTTNMESLLRKAYDSSLFDNYLLEIPNKSDYQILYKDKEITQIDRAFFFLNTAKGISPYFVNYFLESEKEIDNPIFGSNLGYTIFPENLLMGFAKEMYFSFNETSLFNTLDLQSSLSLLNNEKLEISNDVAVGHFTKGGKEGVVFKNIKNKQINGKSPQNLDEIVISSGLLNKLKSEKSQNISSLYLGYPKSETTNSKGTIYRDFAIRNLDVVGTINDEDLVIYGDPFWTIGFFQTRLGISSFDLQVKSIAFEVKNSSKIKEIKAGLQKKFPQYEITNPMEGINDSINQICRYLEIALASFSFVAVLISILLLSLSNYLYLIESKKDIGLARCIGLNVKESKKFILFQSVMTASLAFIMSTIELVVLCLITKLDSIYFNKIGLTIVFNPLSLVAMFVLAMSISIVSSLFISRKLNKLNPLEALNN